MKIAILGGVAVLAALAVGCVGYGGAPQAPDWSKASTPMPFSATPEDPAMYEDACLALAIANGHPECPDVILPSGALSEGPMEVGETRILPDGSTLTMVDGN